LKLFNTFIVLVLLICAGAGALFWYFILSSHPGPQKTFIVNKGENFVQVAAQLQAANIIKSERAFRWYVALQGARKSLKRGEYALREGMSVAEVYFELSEGKFIEYKFTIPEGANLFQVAQHLEEMGLANAKAFILAGKAPDVVRTIPTYVPGTALPPNVEGYLYPETYMLQKVYSEKEILHIFMNRFREIYKNLADKIKTSPHLEALHLTPAEVITLASIVEKETGAAVERPLVASVFLNRLRIGMRLQSDPTIIYGMWERDGTFDGNIHKSDILNSTPYNTYTVARLPIAPVCNPGLSALEAVLNPANTDYLFFVSKNDGTHTFSKNYGDHNRAVRDLQIKPKAREGKSWRNLPAERRANHR
jgi:UPF0755 protein